MSDIFLSSWAGSWKPLDQKAGLALNMTVYSCLFLFIKNYTFTKYLNTDSCVNSCGRQSVNLQHSQMKARIYKFMTTCKIWGHVRRTPSISYRVLYKCKNSVCSVIWVLLITLIGAHSWARTWRWIQKKSYKTNANMKLENKRIFNNSKFLSVQKEKILLTWH